MNYFECYGSTIWTEERNILRNASAWRDEIDIKCYQRYDDGHFEIISFCNSRTFVCNNKLYYFLTNSYGQIISFFDLNLSKESCENEEHFGVYFTFKINCKKAC